MVEKLNVNPTRMELTNLKRRLVTARRGHKLLKDKCDELMKQFLAIVQQNKTLRLQVEEALAAASRSFAVASASMSPEMMEQSLIYPKQSVDLDYTLKNIMSVNVPVYEYKMATDDTSDIYPYGFANTPGELDDAVSSVVAILPRLLELTALEKTVQLLSIEIEKTRRRVNALEYVMIPQLQETIRYISMKLDENERGNLSRLMKVKDMMLAQAGYGANA